MSVGFVHFATGVSMIVVPEPFAPEPTPEPIPVPTPVPALLKCEACEACDECDECETCDPWAAWRESAALVALASKGASGRRRLESVVSNIVPERLVGSVTAAAGAAVETAITAADRPAKNPLFM